MLKLFFLGGRKKGERKKRCENDGKREYFKIIKTLSHWPNHSYPTPPHQKETKTPKKPQREQECLLTSQSPHKERELWWREKEEQNEEKEVEG